jgi:polyisoprenyl-teichoic acid--peptidoglycan teichoic acid transferase
MSTPASGGPPAPWRRIAAAVVALGLAAMACTGAREAEPRSGPSVGPSPSLASPQVAERLDVRLSKVNGFPTKGKLKPRRLRPVAEQVRETMAGLYTAAFVDSGAWGDGRFTEILPFFRGEAQGEARESPDRLTLGRAAEGLAEVDPGRTRLRVDVLTDIGRHPLAALAHMRFAARGLTGDGVETRIRHSAEYLLRRFGDRWQVVAYRIERHLVPEGVPGFPTHGSLFVLAIGSDARKGQSVPRARADSLHVIGVNLGEGKASILGIPRDSFVPIPGHGSDKINASLTFGGPEMTVRTVEQLTGIRMDGYLLTGFEGFKDLVHGIGGVTVRVPYRMSDHASRAYFPPGPRRMNGNRALAFSRNRHDAPGGDFGRSLNQGSVILAALRELRSEIAKDPLTLFRWMQVAREHLQTDLGLDEMLALLFAAVSIEPDRVDNRVVSGSGGTVGSASVVRLSSKAQARFRDLRKDGILGH